MSQAAQSDSRKPLWQTRDWVVRQTSAAARRSAAAVVNLICPPTCQLCSQDIEVPGEVHVCVACRAQLKNLRPLCSACAMPLPNLASPVADACPACRHERFRFSSVQAVGLYEGLLRDAVIRMKKAHEEALTLTMGKILAETARFPDSIHSAGDSALRAGDSAPRAASAGDSAAADGAATGPDLVVPVPMHWARRLTRGTNPAELLAEMAAQKLGVPAVSDLLRNRRKTRKQGTLLPDQRRRNVRQAFSVSTGYDIRKTHVLLVDDVMTTGATANELSKMLHRAGARLVSVAVVARGTG
jgi:predicted amidophosphoribosyltransferase